MEGEREVRREEEERGGVRSWMGARVSGGGDRWRGREAARVRVLRERGRRRGRKRRSGASERGATARASPQERATFIPEDAK